ncbi:hypothetical protein Hanom_Chr06g00538461 [Helianthus anomalus]
MRSQKPNRHANPEPVMHRHVSSDGFSDSYHTRVAAHAPDMTRLLHSYYSALITLGSANIFSFQHMPGQSHQFLPTARAVYNIYTKPQMKTKLIYAACDFYGFPYHNLDRMPFLT